jgi:Na+/H+ antiporter NhaD/arsenite permease-like protein
VDYNVVFVNIARKAGCWIACWQCFKFGFPVMRSSIVLSALYFLLVFLR